MRYFQDSATSKPWAFDDDVVVTDTNGVYSFTAAHGARFSTPTTLQPMTAAAYQTLVTNQQAAQAAAAAALPNPQGFITAVKTALGGPVGILGLSQTLQNAIMLTITAINEENYADAQAVIISQETALGATLYGDIKSAVTTYNLPITLP